MHAPGLSVAGGVVITRTAQKQMSRSEERENERPPSKLGGVHLPRGRLGGCRSQNTRDVRIASFA